MRNHSDHLVYTEVQYTEDMREKSTAERCGEFCSYEQGETINIKRRGKNDKSYTYELGKYGGMEPFSIGANNWSHLQSF